MREVKNCYSWIYIFCNGFGNFDFRYISDLSWGFALISIRSRKCSSCCNMVLNRLLSAVMFWKKGSLTTVNDRCSSMKLNCGLEPSKRNFVFKPTFQQRILPYFQEVISNLKMNWKKNQRKNIKKQFIKQIRKKLK